MSGQPVTLAIRDGRHELSGEFPAIACRLEMASAEKMPTLTLHLGHLTSHMLMCAQVPAPQ